MDTHDNKDNGKSTNCKEYQALQYKTMINNGTNIDNVIVNETNEAKINHFLENEIAKNKKLSLSPKDYIKKDK